MSYLSDIAIDDVRVRDGSCGNPGDCKFESDTCLWKNTPGDDFDWVRSKGSTGSQYTGPSIDHTLGTDSGMTYYFYQLARCDVYWLLSDT